MTHNETAASKQPQINHTLTAQELTQISVLAIAAKRKAYCPYSNFRVGAAFLVAGTDTPVQGSNVEVASTPVGICAERCALASLVASMDRPHMPHLRALAVSTDIWPPSSPCGMCRQMIREFCEPEMPVYMYGRDKSHGQTYADGITPEEELKICGEYKVLTIGELLPMSFGPNDMDKREAKGGIFG